MMKKHCGDKEGSQNAKTRYSVTIFAAGEIEYGTDASPHSRDTLFEGLHNPATSEI
jgi:hypothetical protein